MWREANTKRQERKKKKRLEKRFRSAARLLLSLLTASRIQQLLVDNFFWSARDFPSSEAFLFFFFSLLRDSFKVAPDNTTPPC